MVRYSLITLAAVLLVFSISCSEHPVNPIDANVDPGSGSNNVPNQELLNAPPDLTPGGRYLWGYWNMSVDPDTYEVEATPLRNGTLHLNILKFLEDTLCQTCLVIGDNQMNADNDLEVQIGIIHPIDYDGSYVKEVFTGFDVRGIAVFEGTYYFDENGMKVSRTENDEYIVVDADGYTPLWSPADYAPGSNGRDIFEYYPAKLEVNGLGMSTTLNPYRAYYTLNERRVFEAADHDERLFTIRFPGIPFSIPLEFGYAVDASWAKPSNIGAPDVPDDFPPAANSFEAYRTTANLSGALTPFGGLSDVLVRVYDWQGPETIASVTLEAPDIFNGLITMLKGADFPNYSEYTATFTNELGAEIGSYPMLLSVNDTGNIPFVGPAVAYNIFELEVKPPLNLEETVELENDPIEGAYDSVSQTCYFAPVIGVPGKEVMGINQAYNVVQGFPGILATGGIGLCEATREIYSATDTGQEFWEDDISVFDIDDKALVRTINVPSEYGNPGSTPIDFAVYENLTEVWVSLFTDNQVGVFLAGIDNPDITRINVGTGPTTLAFDQGNYRLFVACDGNDTVSVVDGFSQDIEDTINLHTPFESPDPGIPGVMGMAYVPDLDMLFVTTLLHGTIDYYDLTDYSYKGAIVLSTGGEIILGLIYDPVTEMLIATSHVVSGNGQIYAVDPNTKTIVYTADTTGLNPSFPGLDETNQIVYVPDPIGHVDIYSIVE